MMPLKSFLSSFVLSMVMIGATEAGQITNLQLYDGTSVSPIVTINYTNADGTGNNSAAVYADPQVSNGTTTPMYYCVDIWHENDLGSTYTINPVSSISFGTSTFSDADNRIGWLLTQDQTSVDARAAVQLAIWYTIDNVHNAQLAGFSFSGGDANIKGDYQSLIGFAGYNPNLNYAADFERASHGGGCNTLYQDLVSGPVNITTQSVPEPGSIVLAGIALLSLAGVQLRRRAE